jgi:TonB family protein
MMTCRKGAALTLLVAGLFALGGAAVASGDETFVAARPVGQSRVEPNYPPAALRAGYEATLVLAAEIASDGRVSGVSVIDVDRPSLGFEAAAVDALQQWRFEPAMLNDEPVDSLSYVRLHFRVPGSRLNPDGQVSSGVVAAEPRLGGNSAGGSGAAGAADASAILARGGPALPSTAALVDGPDGPTVQGTHCGPGNPCKIFPRPWYGDIHDVTPTVPSLPVPHD